MQPHRQGLPQSVQPVCGRGEVLRCLLCSGLKSESPKALGLLYLLYRRCQASRAFAQCLAGHIISGHRHSQNARALTELEEAC